MDKVVKNTTQNTNNSDLSKDSYQREGDIYSRVMVFTPQVNQFQKLKFGNFKIFIDIVEAFYQNQQENFKFETKKIITHLKIIFLKRFFRIYNIVKNKCIFIKMSKVK